MALRLISFEIHQRDKRFEKTNQGKSYVFLNSNNLIWFDPMNYQPVHFTTMTKMTISLFIYLIQCGISCLFIYLIQCGIFIYLIQCGIFIYLIQCGIFIYLMQCGIFIYLLQSLSFFASVIVIFCFSHHHFLLQSMSFFASVTVIFVYRWDLTEKWFILLCMIVDDYCLFFKRSCTNI